MAPPVLARYIPRGTNSPVGAIVVPALPSPPMRVSPNLTTQFADVYAADQAEIARHTMTPEKGLVDEMVKALRNFNFTVGLPAHIRPHIWSNPVDVSGSVALQAAVSQYQTVATFTCPPGRWARIEQYGVNVLDPTYTYDGSILWAFRGPQGAYLDQGMSNWGEQRGSMVFPRKTFVILQEGQTLDFQVRRAVAAGAPQNVQMGFRGWTWRLRNNYEGTQASVTAY